MPKIADLMEDVLDTDEINDEAENLNVDPEKYRNLLIALSEDEVRSSFTAEGEYSGPGYLDDPLTCTACYPGSLRLRELLKAPGAVTLTLHAFNKKGDSDTLRAFVQGLVNDIQQRCQRDEAIIYRIACAEHGFVLILREKRIEHLESFANAKTLLENIRETRSYLVPQVCHYLNDLVNEQVDVRRQAARHMGWNIEDLGLSEEQFPTIRFEWDCVALADQYTLIRRINRQIDVNRQIIQNNYQNVLNAVKNPESVDR